MMFRAWTGFARILFFIGGVVPSGTLPPLINSAEPTAMFAKKLSSHAFEPRLGSAFMVLAFALFGTLGARFAGVTWRTEVNTETRSSVS